jgi:predicted PurR-regulated permease PerM
MPSEKIEYNKSNSQESLLLPKARHGFFSMFTFMYAIFVMATLGMLLHFMIGDIISASNRIGTTYYTFVSLFVFLVFLMFLYPVYLLFVTLRPKHRETLKFLPDRLEIDTGTHPIRYTKSVTNFYRQLKNNRRRSYSVDKKNVLKTRLIRDEDLNYLQVIHKHRYVDIAAGTSDKTREFLFNYILDYYENQSTNKNPD